MTDWSKLKVPELKAELKKRNLPITGLKADLVARLSEADVAPADHQETDPAPAEEHGDATEDTDEQKGVNSLQEETEAETTLDQHGGLETASPAEAAPAIDDPPHTDELAEPSAAMPENGVMSADALPTTAPVHENVELTGTEAPSSSHLPSVEPQELVADKQKRKRRSQSPPPPGHDSARKRARQDEDLPFTNADGNTDDETRVETTVGDSKWVDNHNGTDAMPLRDSEIMVEGEGTGVIPESAPVDTAEDEPRTTTVETTVEDVKWLEKHNGVDAPALSDTEMQVEADGKNLEPRPVLVDTVDDKAEPASDDGVMKSSPAASMDTAEQQDMLLTATYSEVDQRPAAANPSSDDMSTFRTKDSRFKGLFTSGQDQQMESNGDAKLDTIDDETERDVEPALHPATSALYIREFMRPLNAASLKEYLTVLATAPGMTVDPAVITEFFLDPIRTHAFIAFTSVAAASRVRSSIHGRVWPDERNRKPLWSDFIPSEKIAEWQGQETPADRPRGAGKKWEVVYEADGDGHIDAFLQEASIVPAMQRTSTLQQRASSPRPMQRRVSVPHPEPVNTTQRVPGTSTLDGLFQSTRATPILYYQPVPQSLVDRRLESIRQATSKRYDGPTAVEEINRYTFEDGDSLVDRGPEIFPGIRPPPRGGRMGGRGAPRGGFRGRGNDRGWDRGYDYGRERYDRGPDRYDRGQDRYGRYEESRNDRYRDRRY